MEPVATSLVGSTGLVGSHILTTLLAHPSVSTISAFARRELKVPDPNSRLRPIIHSNPEHWPSDFASFEPKPSIFFSGLGTTKAIAGSFENQYKIDHDLNLALAKAAKDSGVRVYVLISGAGANSKSSFPYMRMKGELDDGVSKLGFEKVVIVRPGLIVGNRTDTRLAEYSLRQVALFAGKLSGGLLKDFWAQDADVIARAAVAAGFKALEGASEVPQGNVWMVNQGDIIRLGRKQ